MRRYWLAFFLFAFPFVITAQNTIVHNPPPIEEQDPSGYASRDATVLSMMGWGVGLAVGIAVLCSLIKSEQPS